MKSNSLFPKAVFLTCLLVLVSIAFVQAQDVLGVWFNQEKDAKIEIYKSGTKYYGKLVWMQNPLGEDKKPRKDVNNPNKQLAEKELLGLLLLKDFNYVNKTTFEDGTIYDPKSGKTYSCIITVKDASTLSIRGYVGISMLGRTTIWTRTTL